jgi:hypothetical protein
MPRVGWDVASCFEEGCLSIGRKWFCVTNLNRESRVARTCEIYCSSRPILGAPRQVYELRVHISLAVLFSLMGLTRSLYVLCFDVVN